LFLLIAILIVLIGYIKQTPMQSLQADQSLYNRKGVCYIVHVIGRFQVIRRLYLLIRDRKYTKNINKSSQNQ